MKAPQNSVEGPPPPGAAGAVARGEPEGNLPCTGWMRACSNRNAIRRRQNTSYVDEERNWVTLCPTCMAANAEYWEQVWAELYSGCG